jgi:hypothetical protein
MLASFWRGPFILSRPAHGRIGRSLTAADFRQRTGAGPVEARIIRTTVNKLRSRAAYDKAKRGVGEAAFKVI